MPERPYATGDRVRITLNATVTDYDEANEDLTVHYSTVLGTHETTVAVDSSYVQVEDLKGGAPSAETDTCPHGVPRHGYFVVRETAAHETQVYCMCCGRPGIRDTDDTEPMPCPSCGVNAVLDNRGARC